MKGSILFLSKREDAASTRYRIFQYKEALESKGWQCEYRPTNKLTWRQHLALLREAKQHDIVFIQRKLFNGLSLCLLKYYNPCIVFDYDDAIFLNDNGTPSKRRLKRFQQITANSRAVFAGNQYLAGYSKCINTLRLPTTIRFADYEQVSSPKPASHRLVLVWIGSSATKKYLEAHRDTFEAIGKQYPNLTLRIISDFTLNFEHLNVECVPWSKEKELEALYTADIGVAPMLNDPWTLGKCGLKVIQYMASGLPVISDNVGANSEIILNNETGILANTSDDWLAAIATLEDEKTRIKMGENGRARAKIEYAMESQVERLDQALEALLD
ncbi:glycosyltransferase [Aurantivibrio plasticivorans]